MGASHDERPTGYNDSSFHGGLQGTEVRGCSCCCSSGCVHSGSCVVFSGDQCLDEEGHRGCKSPGETHGAEGGWTSFFSGW